MIRETRLAKSIRLVLNLGLEALKSPGRLKVRTTTSEASRTCALVCDSAALTIPRAQSAATKARCVEPERWQAIYSPASYRREFEFPLADRSFS